MPDRPRALLYDIAMALRLLKEFAAGKSFEDYENNVMLRSAVERQFMIIGEAMVELNKAAPDIVRQIPDYQAIIGFRNVLVHGYSQVEHRTVWHTLQNDVPVLLKAVEAVLSE